MKSPILGGSNVARSVHAAANRIVNLYPEISGDGGKDAAFLTRTPGLRLLGTAGEGPIRGMHPMGSYLYIVSGSELYRTNSTWTPTLLGSVSTNGTVSMADNGTQLFVACGTRGYIYNASTTTFAEITDVDFPGATTVGYLDGYFVFNEPGTQTLWITSLLDGTAIDPLDFASAEGFPDNLRAIAIDHREAWLFGSISTEVWYNSGAADFPLQRRAVLEIGIASSYCVSKMDNSLFWLGNDGIVYRADGYHEKRVSTHAVESWIEDNATLSNATSYSYRQDGHQFYVLNFSGALTSWVYDAATGAWHERASWNDGEYIRHRGECAAYFADRNIVGDYQNGKFYKYDLSYYTDNTETLRWLRSWRALPPGTNELKRQTHHSLQLDIDAGTGLSTGQGRYPEVMLRWSNDGGKTWGNELWREIGAIGETGTRAIWRRLGDTDKLRDRVYEVSGSDPVRIVITGAQVDVEASDA